MILKKINDPSDLKNLNISELETLAEEMRAYLLAVLSKHPGHFAPNFRYCGAGNSSAYCL